MAQRPTRRRAPGSVPPRPHTLRRLLAGLAALVVVLLAAAVPARPVSAHAELLEITPADGEIVDSAPSQVVLRFSEPVSLTGGSAGVLDDDATEVSTGAQGVDGSVTITLPTGLADGTYTVTWQVISVDSHRISGASVFHIGSPSADGVPVIGSGADEVGWGVRSGASLLSAMAYAGALIGVGGFWWLVLLAGRRDDERLDAPAEPAWRMVIGRAMVLGAVTLLAALPFRIAKVGGGLDALRDDNFLWATLRGPIGVATAVTAIALLVTAGLLGPSRDRRDLGWLGAATGTVALAGFAIEGHTRSQHPLVLMVGFDVIHLAAAAVWVGGIAGLVVAFRSDVEPTRLGRMVGRFSTAAVVSVLVVAVAGVGMAWIVLPSLDDLVTTGYGLALLTKVALVAVVVVLGAYNNRRLVPVVRAGTSTSDGPRRRLARIVQVELVLLLVVVGVTAVLVGRSPVAASQAAPAPVTIPPGAVELPLSNGAGTASVAVAPARVGSNEIRLVLLDAAGQPLDPVDTPTIELTEPALELGPLRPVVHVLGTGDFHIIADVPIAGSWELTIRIRVSDFDAATATTVVEIQP